MEVAVPDGTEVQWFAKNLSPKGIFIQTSSPLPVGTEVGLRVVDSHNELLFEAKARVLWGRVSSSGAKVVPGMGLVFSEVSEKSRATIERICTLNPDEQRRWEGFFRATEEGDLDAGEEGLPGHNAIGPQRRKISDLVMGIDLGTTYSCVSYVDWNGRPVVIPTDTGYHTTPSVVTVTDNVVVGRAAVDLKATLPRKTVYGHKRLLGSRFNSQLVQRALKKLNYEVIADEGGDAAVRIEDKTYPMAWFSAQILKEMVAWTEEKIGAGELVRKAIITVPAYYTDRQRQAVLQAARMADLEVLQLVNEPTAAAVAYGIDRGYRKQILVYDLGGGTFDVSILKLNGNVFEVVTTGGDPYLGGLDFDNRIVEWLLEGFLVSHGINLAEDRIVRTRLAQAAETAKRDLSELLTARLNLPYVARRGDEILHLDVELTREQLNRLTRDLVDRSIEIVEQTLQQADLTKDDIDQVILVGGQTNAPLVQGAVHNFIGRVPQRAIHPEEAMAIGAALLGDGMRGVESVVLLDVVSRPIGIASDNRFKPIIARDTPLPARKELHWTTERDNQTEAVFHVYQGEAETLSENEFLGSVRIGDLPPRPLGEVRIDLEFDVDKQGFLRISSRDSATGNYQVVRLITSDAPGAVRDVLPVGPEPG